MKKLLLWDLDGTLVDADGAGRRAIIEALRKSFNFTASLKRLAFIGRTDRHIMDWVFKLADLPNTEENRKRLKDNYLRYLKAELPRGNSRLLPGAREVLETVHRRPEIIQGVLTGNIVDGARAKLEFHGISGYFPFGGYGDEHCERHAIGLEAMQRATEYSGHTFEPECVYVIGDTTHDIACGKAMGAKTIALSTGFVSAAKLRQLEPTALLAGLDDSDAFFAAIDG